MGCKRPDLPISSVDLFSAPDGRISMKLPSFILASLSAYKDTNMRQIQGVSISDNSKLSDSDLTN